MHSIALHYSITLWWTIVHYILLYCMIFQHILYTALYCIMLHYIAYWSILNYIALYWTLLYYIELYCVAATDLQSCETRSTRYYGSIFFASSSFPNPNSIGNVTRQWTPVLFLLNAFLYIEDSTLSDCLVSLFAQSLA